MHIDTLLNSVKQQFHSGKQNITLSIPSSWAQGRTLYGGISAALVYQAMREMVAPEKLLRSLNTSFVGPIESETNFEIIVEILREGKNVTQVAGRLIQNNNVAVMCLASFGIERPSSIQVPSNVKHSLDYPNKTHFLPLEPEQAPKFLGHFDINQSKGDWPFSGGNKSNVAGWMRFKEHNSAISDAHLVALIDVWPPTVLQMFKKPSMASSMNWNLEFIHPHREMTGVDWFAYDAKTVQAAEGYAHTEANIWNKEGALVAISRQVVAVFG